MNFPTLRIARAAVLAIGFLSGVSPAQAATPPASPLVSKHPFTIDDLLRIETLGEVMFAPDGAYVLFEKLASRAEATEFGRPIFRGQQSAHVYIARARDGWVARPLPDQAAGEGYTLRAISPDGRAVIIAHAAEGSLRYEAVDIATGARVVLPGTPDQRWSHGPQQPVWIGAHEVVYATTAGGRLPSLYSGHAEAQEAIAAARASMRSGRTVTAEVFGESAGDRPDNQGAMVRVDVVSGAARTLARGNFVAWFVSKDRQWLAAVRAVERPMDPAIPVDEHVMPTGLERRLDLVALEGPSRMVVCPDCDVSPAQVSWSEDQSSIAFLARGPGKTWRSASLMRYDIAGARLETAVESPAPRLATYPLDPIWAWCGDRIEVAIPPSTDACPKSPGRGTQAVPWRAPAHFDYVQTNSDARNDDASVMAAQGGAYFARLAGRDRWRRIDAPSSEAQPAAFSPKGDAAAFVEHPDNTTVLTLVRPGQPSIRLVQLNAHLATVREDQAVKIEHRGPNGEALISWLLLPADWRPGKPLPVICSVYSGSVGRASGPNAPLWNDLQLNPHLYTAHGFAVLLPSLPFPGPEGEREPAKDRAALILSAVDAAAALGYVDPKRIGVTGQSNGGYTVAVALAQSDRFAAGVAEDGLYDLASVYGQFDVTQEVDFDHEGVSVNVASGLELGQQGLGVPPWKDPEKYVRNSPVFAADRIHTPLMLIHGDIDRLSDGQAEEVFTALHRLGREVVLVKYRGEGHVVWSPANIRDKWARVLDWFDQRLGGPL